MHFQVKAAAFEAKQKPVGHFIREKIIDLPTKNNLKSWKGLQNLLTPYASIFYDTF